MAERKVLANAIRFLSMDAVQKLTLVTLVPNGYGRYR
ncbi:transketolase [Actinobacillus equuli]|nr:transketolase [Actinobacillus equuli]